MIGCEICAYDPLMNYTYKTRDEYVQHMDMVHNVRFAADGRSQPTKVHEQPERRPIVPKTTR